MRARKLSRSSLCAVKTSEASRQDIPISLPAVFSPSAGEERRAGAPPKAACAVNLPPVVPDCLASDLQGHDPDTTGGLSFTTLAARTPRQCCFPLWPKKARPGDPDYGQVCGAAVAKPGAPYCSEHARIVAGSHAETQKAKRIVRATVRTARAKGIA